MNRLRQLRELRGKTQQDIADFLNLTQKAVSFYELGQRDIPNDALLKLADYFNVSTDFILGRFTKEEQELINKAAKQLAEAQKPRFATGLLGDLGDKIARLDTDETKAVNEFVDFIIHKRKPHTKK